MVLLTISIFFCSINMLALLETLFIGNLTDQETSDKLDNSDIFTICNIYSINCYELDQNKNSIQKYKLTDCNEYKFKLDNLN